jgi:hypothetical protein
VTIATRNGDGRVTSVCYHKADPDDSDPLEAVINGSYQHVIPSRSPHRFLPCYGPEQIGEAEFKRAALLRKEWNEQVNKMTGALVDRMLHPKPDPSNTTQKKSDCTMADWMYAPRNTIGGMYLGGGCH